MICQIALAEDFVLLLYCQTADMVAETKMVPHIDSVLPKWGFEKHAAFILSLKAQHLSQKVGKRSRYRKYYYPLYL